MSSAFIYWLAFWGLMFRVITVKFVSTSSYCSYVLSRIKNILHPADDSLKYIYISYFSQKIDFDFSCKLSQFEWNVKAYFLKKK